MVNNDLMNVLTQKGEFPLIECIYARSSNVNGDEVSAYAVTKAVKTSEGIRLNALKGLIGQISSAPSIIKGFSYASTEKWTVADDIVKEHKIFNGNDNFEVIWLQNTLLNSDYHGNAGYEIHRLRGIVLHYPEELCM